MINRLNIFLLNFVRRFYDQNLPYTSHLYEKWLGEIVPQLMDILYNGVISYISLKSILFIFPWLSKFIFLGEKLWHVPFVIIALGFGLWFIQGIYKWFKTGWKT